MNGSGVHGRVHSAHCRVEPQRAGQRKMQTTFVQRRIHALEVCKGVQRTTVSVFSVVLLNATRRGTQPSRDLRAPPAPQHHRPPGSPPSALRLETAMSTLRAAPLELLHSERSGPSAPRGVHRTHHGGARAPKTTASRRSHRRRPPLELAPPPPPRTSILGRALVSLQCGMCLRSRRTPALVS